MGVYGDGLCPTDQDFKTHFEAVLNSTDVTDYDEHNDTADITIPVLDEPIMPAELMKQIRKMKKYKASGPDGFPPSVFPLLPDQWMLSITTLFNNTFTSGIYLQAWTRAKVFTIFKKDNRVDPNNYRGISVINNIAKLYDMVLCQRLSLLFKPFREQAGAQKHRC